MLDTEVPTFQMYMYNVKKQDELYKEAIKKIWKDQKESLEDTAQHDDEDIQPQEDEDDRFNSNQVPATPVRFDESMSQISRPSTLHAQEKRKLRIKRKYTGANGETITKIEIVHDPGVIAQYLKQRALLDSESIEFVSLLKSRTEYPSLTSLARIT